MLDVQLVVLAKAPVPGRVKTRLCPPLTAQQAADVAAACLADTLATVGQTGFRRRLVALDGPPDGLLPAGFEVLTQRGSGLDERLAAACEDAFAGSALPLLLIGMDTPQLTVADLTSSARALLAGTSVLGLAEDGGWWAVGLRAADREVFLGVPMSTAATGSAQETRMRRRGLAPTLLAVHRDIDEVADLTAVAAGMDSASRLAAVVRELPALTCAGSHGR